MLRHQVRDEHRKLHQLVDALPHDQVALLLADRDMSVCSVG